jgi:hypothetical protein
MRPPLSRCRWQTRLLVYRGECSKRRRPCPGARSVCEPGRNSHEVDRRSQQQMHQPGFHQPTIAGAAQIARVGALRNRPCNAGSTGIHLLERFRLLPHPCSLEGGVMISLTAAQCPWRARSARAICSAGTGPTHVWRLSHRQDDEYSTRCVGPLRPRNFSVPSYRPRPSSGATCVVVQCVPGAGEGQPTSLGRATRHRPWSRRGYPSNDTGLQETGLWAPGRAQTPEVAHGRARS